MRIKIAGDELVYDGKYLSVLRRHFADAKNQPQVWEMFRRKNTGKSVSIAAVTDRNEIILEKIFRLPAKKYILELPSGLTDKKNESLKDAICRELLEETGYSIKKAEPFLAGPSNAGLSDDELVIFFANSAKKIRQPEPEDSEDIKVVTVPLKNLPDYLRSISKEIFIDLKIYAAMWFLEQKGLL